MGRRKPPICFRPPSCSGHMTQSVTQGKCYRRTDSYNLVQSNTLLLSPEILANHKRTAERNDTRDLLEFSASSSNHSETFSFEDFLIISGWFGLIPPGDFRNVTFQMLQSIHAIAGGLPLETEIEGLSGFTPFRNFAFIVLRFRSFSSSVH